MNPPLDPGNIVGWTPSPSHFGNDSTFEFTWTASYNDPTTPTDQISQFGATFTMTFTIPQNPQTIVGGTAFVNSFGITPDFSVYGMMHYVCDAVGADITAPATIDFYASGGYDIVFAFQNSAWVWELITGPASYTGTPSNPTFVLGSLAFTNNAFGDLASLGIFITDTTVVGTAVQIAPRGNVVNWTPSPSHFGNLIRR